MSKYSIPGSDGGALLGLLERMRARAQQLTERKMFNLYVSAYPASLIQGALVGIDVTPPGSTTPLRTARGL